MGFRRSVPTAPAVRGDGCRNTFPKPARLSGSSRPGLVALVFLLLMHAYFPPIRWWYLRLPVVRGWIGPRLTFDPIDDSALGDSHAGVWLLARIKQMRDDALARDGDFSYDLDFARASEEFADLVSGGGALQSSLNAASDIANQTKTVSAVLNLLSTLLPIQRFTMTGALDSPSNAAVSAALTLEYKGRLEAASMFSGPSHNRETATATDFEALADPCAVRIQYEVSRVLSGGDVDPDAGRSYALVRDGLDRYPEHDKVQARALFV